MLRKRIGRHRWRQARFGFERAVPFVIFTSDFLMNPRAFAALISSAVALNFTFSQVLASSADDEITEAQRCASKGAFEDSVAHWKKADTLFEQAKNSSGQVDAEKHLA